MGRSLFVGSYLQVTCWALGQWKERKNASNDNLTYLLKANMIDPRDTDKSQYYAISKFNYCFIIRSQSLFSYLIHSLIAEGSDLSFLTQELIYNYV